MKIQLWMPMAALGILSLMACGREPAVTTVELAGRWSPAPEMLTAHALTNGGTFDLETTGAFSGTVPSFLYRSGENPPVSMVEGSGNWSLTNVNGRSAIQLVFLNLGTNTGSFSVKPLFVQRKPALTLFFEPFDPGNDRFYFHRVGAKP